MNQYACGCLTNSNQGVTEAVSGFHRIIIYHQRSKLFRNDKDYRGVWNMAGTEKTSNCTPSLELREKSEG
jgi:hypothetical protein